MNHVIDVQGLTKDYGQGRGIFDLTFQAVSGTGNTRMAFLLELSSLVIYMAYCYLVIHIIQANVAVCWTAEHIYGAVMMLLCGWYLLSGKWKNRVI